MTQRGSAFEHWSATRLPSVEAIRQRLARVFPEGIEMRAWAIAERAARSLFVFLYACAVEGMSERRIRPAMVTTMSDEQAEKTRLDQRLDWWEQARRPRSPQRVIAGRWYAENTREPIRDETFRAWRRYGALKEDAMPTTSSMPRYFLARDFADLFDPQLDEDAFERGVEAWRSRHLERAALARTELLRQRTTAGTGAQVRFPDGSARTVALGPSTPLLKAALEDLAPRFLHLPVVLVVTESRQRLRFEDASQLEHIGLRPDARVMPDLLLADVGHPDGQLRLVFLECVATAGAMTTERMADLRLWLARNGFANARVALGTVFWDRADPVYRRWGGELAWGSFVWFASEPDRLLVLLEQGAFEPRATLDALAIPVAPSDLH